MKKHLLVLLVLFASVSLMGIFNYTSAQTQRNPVLEEFTGTWCQWCPCGHTIMAQIKASYPNAIMIGYHGPANGSDPFSFFSGNTILGSFGVPYWPSGTVDRTGAPNDRGTWASWVNTRNSVPATVAIDVERSFNETTREFNATIDFTALSNLNGQYKFHAILLESGIVWSQAGNGSCPGNSNYVHKHVVRDVMNGVSGTEIVNGAWNTNEVITKTLNHVVPSPGGSGPDMVWDSCDVVILVYKVGSSLSTSEIQQAIEMELKSPDYVATIASSSPDVIGENNNPAQFTAVINNIGLMDDMYYIDCSLDGTSGWTGSFTTINGSHPFGETDSVQVASGDSTEISLTINPNGFSGSANATLNFHSKNNAGVSGSITFRFVTTTGVDVLVIDASEEGYGELVASSVGNVFEGTNGVVSRTALNPSVNLDNFQMITWSAGIALPVFHQAEVDLLQAFMDNGGRLFINGQDVGADIFGAGGQSQFAQSFYNNYMHAAFVGNGSSYLINGYAGDPITDGIQFVLNDLYTRSPDNISPYDANASAIFKYLNGPNIAGIKASTTQHKVVYFGFGFEQISDAAIRDTLISRILNWSGVTVTGAVDNNLTPLSFSLEQNYPNPFNPTTRISYTVPEDVQVSLQIYDVMGREVAQLVNSKQSAGTHSYLFDASSLSSGIYFYKLTAGDFISVKKMTLLK